MKFRQQSINTKFLYVIDVIQKGTDAHSLTPAERDRIKNVFRNPLNKQAQEDKTDTLRLTKESLLYMESRDGLKPVDVAATFGRSIDRAISAIILLFFSHPIDSFTKLCYEFN